MSVKLFIFFFFSMIQFIGINVFLYREKFNKQFVNFIVFNTVMSIIIEFLIFYNIMGDSFGDDLRSYARWFRMASSFHDINEIDPEMKDVGFTYFLYGISLYIKNTTQFFAFMGAYFLFFSILFLYLYTPKELKKEFLYLLLTFLLLTAFNRLYLNQITCVIRASFAATLFLLVVVYFMVYKKQYYAAAAIPFLLLVHKFQFFMFLFMLILAYNSSYRVLRIVVIAALLNFFTHYSDKILLGFLSAINFQQYYHNKVIGVHYLSKILTFQHVTYVMIPLVILLKQITIERYEKLDPFLQLLIKYTLVCFSFTYFLIQISPRGDRLLPIALYLLYFLFTIFASRREKQLLLNFMILVDFVVLYRNLHKFII
jgi:hypothetical protein